MGLCSILYRLGASSYHGGGEGFRVSRLVLRVAVAVAISIFLSVLVEAKKTKAE
jgi:hypothetical protein